MAIIVNKNSMPIEISVLILKMFFITMVLVNNADWLVISDKCMEFPLGFKYLKTSRFSRLMDVSN